MAFSAWCCSHPTITFSNDSVIQRVVKYGGYNVSTVSDLKNQNIEVLKKAASSYIGRNNILAAVEGFGCGLGGAALIAADIPLIFSIAFRVIGQIGATFGYDTQSQNEKEFMMKLIDLGSCTPTVAKMETLLGKEALKDYAKNVTFKQMGKIANARLGKASVEEIAKEMLKSQGKEITVSAVEKMVQKLSEEIARDGWALSLMTAVVRSAARCGRATRQM